MNPFATDPSQSISRLGESKLIENLRLWLGKATPTTPYGMGDDCAVLPTQTPETQQLVTADPLIFGQHFDASITPEQAAAKLLGRNLSDIAAMGGRPTHALISLALDPNVSINWIEQFYRALSAEANAYAVSIVGGDVSQAEAFMGAFLTLYGETLPGYSPLLRHGAKAGSLIFVTGELGGTRLQKHHAFTPRLSEGQWLAQSGVCLSCSDLSDGLGKDFANIIPPSLSCEIDCLKVPISQDARKTAQASDRHPLYHAFNDGEDFELVFSTLPSVDLPSFLADWNAAFATPLSCIGSAVARSSDEATALILKNAPEGFSAIGYEHLR